MATRVCKVIRAESKYLRRKADAKFEAGFRGIKFVTLGLVKVRG
jgi:hypothetical protein